MSALCAIHQPNFFPWLGYFDKIRRCDVFVFLDDVDYPRSGSGGMGSWVNRVKLMAGGEARWVGCPVRRMPLGASIKDAVIDDTQPWRIKLLKTLRANYARAAQFAEAMDVLEPLIMTQEASLSAFNIAAINVLAARLQVTARTVSQSELTNAGRSTALLAELTHAAGCSAYLAGGGAAGYQDDGLFAQHGLELRKANFTPRPYGPPDLFVPGLSVIDYLMHDGRPLAEAFPDE